MKHDAVVAPLAETEIDWSGAGEASADWRAAVAAGAPTRPSFEGTNPVPLHAREAPADPVAALPLTSVGDLLAEADEPVDYLIDGLIQAGSVNVLSAKPKVGKSTLARQLCLAVARGEEFLGRRCGPCGSAWYLAFEGRRHDIRAHFRQMGATEADRLWIHVGQAPKDIIAAVQARAIKERPGLCIIDTMQRFLKARSTDDYAEMTLLFDHVIGIAQKSGAAILLVTHNSKADRSGLDAILGSTAIAGSVDTAILLNRSPRYRTIATVQRTGEDMDETLLVLDETTGRVHLGGSRAVADQDLIVRQLYEALEAAGEPQTQAELFDRVEARRTLKLAALKVLISGNHGNQKTIRTGAGTRNAPYRYELVSPNSSSVVPPIGGNHKSNSLPFRGLSNDSSENTSSRSHTANLDAGTTFPGPENEESAVPEPEDEDDGSRF